ncbi:WD-repeat protein [Cantharellus anzutake]|uniref:WD-repeat protein n=1 Tax=Cantharellus anzutake TaxID=1750568 RepID=UPI001905E410|nr:WD-repeat protein [Cantharellus anzutake]KAF8342883.1 WD-repeat protein [Cantharellus anzutake]
MATRIPPPKRQKIYFKHDKNRPPTPPPAEPAPNVIVQFLSEQSGETPIGDVINVPSDFSRDALELLANKQANEEDDPIPYQFHVRLPDSAMDPNNAGAPTQLVITHSIFEDILSHPKKYFSSEDIIKVYCTPQAVFRVRPATRCSSTLSGHGAAILCASFSPTGKLLATGSGDNNVRLWDLDTELPSHTLSGHRGWVLCVEWEARGRKLASGGYDSEVRLWNPNTGKPLGNALKGHTKWVTSLAWEPIHINPTNPRLASSSKDATVRVWNTANRTLHYTLGGHTASVNVVRWGGAGQGKSGVLYTASSDRTVRIWDADVGKLLFVLKDHAHWVTTLTLNTDFVLRTGPYDHLAKEPSSDAEAQELALKRYNALASTTSELLISGSDDHTLFFWSPFGRNQTGDSVKPITRLTGHQRQVNHVAFSPDGCWAASASWDSSIRMWDGRTGKYVAALRGHVAPVYRLAWSADSRLLVSASKDSTVKIWNLRTYKLHTDLPGHTDEVYCVDFVADKIVSGGRDKKVKIWKN